MKKIYNMRNNTKGRVAYFCFLLSAFSFFVSCEQVEDFSQETDANTVKVVASIRNLQTRVAYEVDGATNFINGDEICVQNILRDTKNIATYTFDGSTWITTDALVWNGGTAESQFQAWYPATASFDEFTLPTDQNSIEELPAADWMTASTSAMVKPADKTINLAFEHKLAKVTVQITEFTSQFGDEPRLMAATIYSLSDEYVTVNGGIKPVLGGNAATAIVCPGKYTPETNLMEVTISDDGRQTFLNVPVNAFLTDTGLEAGKHYKFSLKVGKDAISITKVNVEPWTTKEIDGGVAEEEVYPNIINATAMDATALNEAVVNALELEYTDLTVTLAAEPESEMYAAIRRALIDTEGVVDGSINLTLKGATVMPDHSIKLQDGSIAFGEIWQDENGETLNNPEQVLELHSISLPDMLTIGEGAFEGCGNLTSINAPKVQTIGKYALSKTALTSVEFPELKTITTNLLGSTNTLTSARFPKVTTIENAGLMIGYSFNPESVSLELTAEDDITFNGNSHFNVESQNYSTKVDLVLHSNKQDEVTDGNQWKGYTFKSITFKD